MMRNFLLVTKIIFILMVAQVVIVGCSTTKKFFDQSSYQKDTVITAPLKLPAGYDKKASKGSEDYFPIPAKPTGANDKTKADGLTTPPRVGG